jgi:hypothetical protein
MRNSLSVAKKLRTLFLMSPLSVPHMHPTGLPFVYRFLLGGGLRLTNFSSFDQERKPSWWIVLADEKANRVVVPPMKITDIPFSQPDSDRDYRSYKIQFQAPQAVGSFTWKVHLVSDTFVGEDVSRDITVYCLPSCVSTSKFISFIAQNRRCIDSECGRPHRGRNIRSRGGLDCWPNGCNARRTCEEVQVTGG